MCDDLFSLSFRQGDVVRYIIEETYKSTTRRGKAQEGRSTMGKIHSVPGLFGGEDFYDENGNQVGYSVPGLFGGRDFYDADGRQTGYSVDSVISGEDFYDQNGDRQGFSVDGIFGGHDYYDAEGKHAGYSVPGILGGEHISLDRDPFSADSSDGFDSFDE